MKGCWATNWATFERVPASSAAISKGPRSVVRKTWRSENGAQKLLGEIWAVFLSGNRDPGLMSSSVLTTLVLLGPQYYIHEL